MPQAQNGQITLEFDHFGDRDHPALLLIMGFTAQMTVWETGFCEMLADRGRFVVRFDNRDCGLSSKTQGDPPDTMTIMAQAMSGQPVTADVPYDLSDMAGDAAAVLDHLGIDSAHVVGASMGGMIAQQMAIDLPDRVGTLTSIMSTTGAADVGQPEPAALTALLEPPIEGREANIEQNVEVSRLISGALFDEDRSRERATFNYDRSFYPQGGPFQLAAMSKTGDRTHALRGLDVATLVIHGDVDPLVTPSGGEATAAAIPGAELVMFDQMGHDLPEPLWSRVVDAITAVGDRAR
ncbi:MAG: alpha/beta hydrolase [Actinomycetia bacterium]|nr:alpha/beta hydrolase [Actinomycetes bacterium]